MKRLMIFGMFAIAAVAVAPSTAFAFSFGTVSGRLLFYQNQGNYCPTGRDCTGATYVQGDYNVNAPVSDVKVYVLDSGGSVIGQGITDTQGYYSMSWFSWGTVTSGSINWYAEHKDDRFAIHTSTGGRWVLWTWPTTFVNGGNTDFGWLVWGSAGSANWIANVYNGAWRTWYYAFSSSNRMNAYFTGLEVRAFHNTTTADGRNCPTSCAYGGDNRIYLDDASAFSPQGRIMHEMGHIASYKASRDQSFTYGGDYTRDGFNGWSLTSAEYDAANFEEGLATFFGDAVLYYPWATQPHTCLSSGPCSAGSFNIETSVGLSGSCATDEGRRALSVDRFLWDTYDSVGDSNYTTLISLFPIIFRPASETSSHPYYSFFDTVHALDPGNADNQKDEPWCMIFGIPVSICDRDGRSSYDLKAKFLQWRGDGLDLQWYNNCFPGSSG